MPRTIESVCGNEDEDPFELAVRERDGGCMITDMRSTCPASNNWVSWKAAHICPLEKEDCWDGIFAQHIPECAETKINSLQNGLLMRRDVHNLFEEYLFSINPDVCNPRFEHLTNTLLMFYRIGWLHDYCAWL